jgi:anti-anti-sigma factor
MPQSWFEMHGEIDVYNADTLEDEIRKWLASGRPRVLDLTAVTFIDSTGLNMLARISEHQSPPLILRGVKPTIVKLLDLTGLDRLFTITP